MRTLLFVSAMALCAMPVFAREKPKLDDNEITPPRKMSMKQVLSGKTFPLFYQLKELNAEWHVFNFSNGGANSLSLLYAFYGAGLGSDNSYFTKGDEVLIGAETFIIAYHPKQKPISPAQLRYPGASPEIMGALKLKEDSVLTLSLINLRSANIMSELRGFDLKDVLAPTETSEALPEKGKTLSSESNLRNIGTAMMMYSQDYDETLPPMKSFTKFKEVIMPYIKNESTFKNPISNEAYVLNDILSNHKLAHILKPAEFAFIYEASPAPDGTRGVGFVDGQAKRVYADEWELVKKRSKIK